VVALTADALIFALKAYVAAVEGFKESGGKGGQAWGEARWRKGAGKLEATATPEEEVEAARRLRMRGISSGKDISKSAAPALQQQRYFSALADEVKRMRSAGVGGGAARSGVSDVSGDRANELTRDEEATAARNATMRAARAAEDAKNMADMRAGATMAANAAQGMAGLGTSPMQQMIAATMTVVQELQGQGKTGGLPAKAAA
jgi:hypothetical protein